MKRRSSTRDCIHESLIGSLITCSVIKQNASANGAVMILWPSSSYPNRLLPDRTSITWIEAKEKKYRWSRISLEYALFKTKLLWEPFVNRNKCLKPHCTTYSYLRPLYSKQCLIGACWSPMIPFFLMLIESWFDEITICRWPCREV